ncbi:hypothetical protein PRIPAC_90263 [Pristionchus pacificus]|uniref:Glutathione S-transferase n=1 Tax=Pristionchus pacificus TaxID=54126 RepID=A0A2A6CYA9_PRIPA|nr:hypothetical protein PRIPAC_90263 [Pristionchus pacificus]|eukprot:PDM83149.1 Glutathione S-transferase [Pristionchus pacificus]
MPHYKLTYFDLRGRGEPIRMMFAIAGVPFEDKRVQLQDWEAMAKSKATPFDALPMLEVDGVKFAQTLAILRYIARETGFAGPDNLTAAKADALADQYADFVMAFMPWHIVNAGYAPGDKDVLYDSTYVPTKAKHFPYFEAALKMSTTGWYADTPELTHVDVFIAASLEWLKRMDKNGDKFFDGFPLMEAHYKKFFAHPKLQKYLEERPDAPHSKAMPHYKLTYFDLRARGEPIRMMFAIAGVPLEDVKVTEEAEWEEMVKSKATPFDALPMHEVDGFAGTDNLTAAKADALADQYANFVTAFMPWHIVTAGYAPGDKDGLYDSCYVPTKTKHFPYFEAALRKSSTGWYANTPELTHVDVFIAAGIEWLSMLDKNADKLWRMEHVDIVEGAAYLIEKMAGGSSEEIPEREPIVFEKAASPEEKLTRKTRIMPQYRLTYFDLRGRGEPIRMMFALKGIPYEDRRITLAEAPQLKGEFPFGCLPMLEVDGVKVAQTLSILRYLARENGCAGPDNLTAAIADALADQYADFVMSLQSWLVVTAGYVEADEDALYQSIYEPARAKNFPYFEAALKKSTTGWYANTADYTHADIFIAASLEWLTRLDKNADKLFDGFPLMEAHFKKIFALPAIEKHMPHYKLTYFNVRGRGEPVRMMFTIAGVPFEDKRIDKADWPELKKTFPFGTLPVLEVDGVQIGQTLAIVRYVAREFGLAGPDNLTAALADALADQFVDFLQSTEKWLVSTFGGTATSEEKDEIYNTVFVPAREKHFAYFEAALAKSTTGWYAGTPELTHADVVIANYLAFVSSLDKNADKLFEGFPLMEAQYKKFFAHPKLQKYLAERPDAIGEPVRMMFAIAGVPFEDKRIEKADWPELKKTFPFGALPVLEVDGVQIGQTLAIVRYVAREFGFAGPDNLTAALADALADQFVDFLTSTEKWIISTAGDLGVAASGDKDEIYNTVYAPAREKHFAYFEAALAKSTTGWYAGTLELTHADVVIAEFLEFVSRLDKNADKLFEGFPLMEAQYKKFFAHPKLQNGEVIRMMFAIARVHYEDVRIQKDEWERIKESTPFEALPMLEVDGVKIAQTQAILRYIAREFGHAGPDNLSSAIADSLADQYVDFLTSMYAWLAVVAGHFEGDEDALYKSVYLPAREKNFPYFEAALKKSTSGWYAGTPCLTHADVLIAASLEFLIRLDKNGDKIFEGFPLMELQYKKFFALPTIVKHVAERPDARY